MPRNGSGVYSPPAGTLATTLTPIESAKYNAFVNDLTADANAARPISVGGTGGTSVATAQTALSLDNKVVYAAKSGNYTALGTDNNAVHRYTATATVTLTAAATLGTNWHYTVIANGADVTIDPNGAETIDGLSTLIVPNGASAYIICNGSAFFTSKSIISPQPYATIASAATTDLSTVGSQNVTVTGTTTITAFGTAPAGTFRRLVFSGILTLTHNATSLILPQGGNVVTAAGDSLEAVSLGSGNWRVTSYQKVSAGTGLISGTVVSASGTAVDFTSIPSWVKRITVAWGAISTNGTSGLGIQIGPSGGLETSGYASTSGGTLSTTHFLLVDAVAAVGVYHGIVVLALIDASTNTWACSTSAGRTDTAASIVGAGSKSIAGSISQLRFKAINGTDTFDAGKVNILYE
ncbi:hypothetical protein [Rhizobium phage RHEph18]|uniref:hypothetical protein n=1 Tax=Rhizobium TaxID=379 RepID=UPI0007EC2423|nr:MULTISPECIES: hypothetical protein [Rhizobium]ANL02706.1 hypothetical protein AMJ99_CH01119 [Rhizobium esperanzae]ANM33558.1 hypothetical protein AMK04_CH01120 [Rhizobium sp. N871]QIG73708.1 hypothetical protein EVC05_016 [Rhizobium phage RHph_N2]QXV74426.1 hypothetical protein [Rhizobium phage RHEph18]